MSDEPAAPERDTFLLRRRPIRSAIRHLGRVVADPMNDWMDDDHLALLLQAVIDAFMDSE